MGQKISQSKNTIDISVYMNKYYSDYTTIKILNNGMLSKTVLLLNEGENKCPLVAKIFFKQDFEEEYKTQLERLEETKNKIEKECLHDVLLPFINKVVENQRSGMILRQYLEYYSMFCRLDTSDDFKINLDEFKKGIPLMEKWGVKIDNPEAEFNKIDKNKGGSIMFDEFAEYAIKKNLDLEDDDDFDDEELKNFKSK